MNDLSKYRKTQRNKPKRFKLLYFYECRQKDSTRSIVSKVYIGGCQQLCIVLGNTKTYVCIYSGTNYECQCVSMLLSAAPLHLRVH